MIYIVCGTRPDIIKLAPVIHELKKRFVPHRVVHTGQHYSKSLDQDLRNELDIQIDFRLQVTIGRGVDASLHTIYTQFCKYLASDWEPNSKNMVVVYGDTLSALACATAAKAMQYDVGHIEAGLRSFDLTMPEEVARINIDAISDRLYAPTYNAYENLMSEHHNPKSIKVFGNTIMNTLHKSMGKDCTSPDVDDLLLSHRVVSPFAVFTLHRPENVNADMTLKMCLKAAETIAVERDLKTIVFLCHPRTLPKVYPISEDSIFLPMESVPHHIMLGLISRSDFVMTDSGGIQEECALLDKKLITFRKSTERPETLASGHNILISPYTHDFNKDDYVWEAVAHLNNLCMTEVTYGRNPAEDIAVDLANYF